MPDKKPRKGVLTDEDREMNRLIAKVRIAVENVLCQVRKFRACGGFFRTPFARHGVMWGCVAGLVNLRTLDRLALDPI